MTEEKVREGFSKAATRYDGLTDLHQKIGERLIKEIKRDQSCSRALDVGMGTGHFTGQLTSAFPEAMIVGIDFASGMIDHAQEKRGGFKIVQADASFLPFKENTFDLIVSNLAYQWVKDLPQAFQACRSRLSDDGKLYLTMFGRGTFDELFVALEASLDKKGKGGRFLVERLVSKEQVAASLREAGLRTLGLRSEHIKVPFFDMMELIKWIKAIGANALPTNIYVGKDLLFRANRFYNKHFKDRSGVYATFEVLWVEAQR